MLLSNGLLRLLSCCQTITVVLAAVPKQFDRVIAFGDSLADAGYVSHLLLCAPADPLPFYSLEEEPSSLREASGLLKPGYALTSFRRVS